MAFVELVPHRGYKLNAKVSVTRNYLGIPQHLVEDATHARIFFDADKHQLGILPTQANGHAAAGFKLRYMSKDAVQLQNVSYFDAFELERYGAGRYPATRDPKTGMIVVSLKDAEAA